jgi:hypothetical protein
MPIFGQKTGFRARMNEIKSGIPCSARDDMTTRARNPRFLMPLFGQKTGMRCGIAGMMEV